MAKIKSTVYLGFDDEEISPNCIQLNSTLNKIGGKPDFPSASGDINVSLCAICGMSRPLILQMYAPLEASQFHRTLYIFACLNPTCSQNAKAWTCIRTQYIDSDIYSVQDCATMKNNSKIHINWCSGVDDWGGTEEIDAEIDDFKKIEPLNEENGNVIEHEKIYLQNSTQNTQDDDDDDDNDSFSMENDLVCEFENLDVNPHRQNSKDDPNANCASGPEPANTCDENIPDAEIETAETDHVLVDTPEKPARDLLALLKHIPLSTPNGLFARISDVTLKSYFIAVEIEQYNIQDYSASLSDDHVREMYEEYTRQSNAEVSQNEINPFDLSAAENSETYEKTLPAHGDIMFHQFLTTIQRNPGQILRYTRDSLPLLIAPLKDVIPRCPNCNGDTICEVQILPTLISKLRFQQNGDFAPIEYGNVLIFTCLKSCWDTPDKMRFERIVVQAEK